MKSSTKDNRHRIHTVKRGIMLTRSFRDELNREVVFGRLPTYQHFVSYVVSPIRDYRLGSSLIFSVNKPIFLHGAGFYGAEGSEEFSNYKINVELAIEDSKVLAKVIGNENVKRRSIFKVFFQEKEKLEPHESYELSFHLDGPSTCSLDPVSVSNINVQASNVLFQFRGRTLQVPELYFSLS